MDLKKEAARRAYSLVENHGSVGLGDGMAVRQLASFIIAGMRNGLELKLYTSSLKTEAFLLESGLQVHNIADTDYLDQYFDGCDQIDHQLNALKSGSGIHTREKLLASMAKQFFILADETKYTPSFDSRFPLVLEVLTGAEKFVSKEIVRLFPGTTLSIRTTPENENVRLCTRDGNYLMDCWFAEWPDAQTVQTRTRHITGVIEISLFYKLVFEAVIAGAKGIRRYQRKNDLVELIGLEPLPTT